MLDFICYYYTKCDSIMLIPVMTVIIIIIITAVLIGGLLYILIERRQKIQRSIMDLITVMSTKKEVIIVVDGQILVNPGGYGLNFVVLKRKTPIKVKDIRSFSICCSPSEIQNLAEYVDNMIGTDDIVIVGSRGSPFELVIRNDHANDLFIKTMKKLGMKKFEFTDYSNYVLIGSKQGDFYTEMLTDEIAYHPQFEIEKIFCRQNPFSAYPPKNYLFFDEKVLKDDTIIRCALERSSRATPSLDPSTRNKIGLVDNQCVFVDDSSLKAINRAKDDDRCLNGSGSIGALSLYQIAPLKQAVLVYEFPNYKGKVKELSWGEFQVNKEIFVGSIVIPKDYYVHFVYTPNKLRTLYGHIKEPSIPNLLNGKPLDMIAITKRYNNSVIFCDQENCFALPPGSHVLPPYLFLKINQVIVNQYTSHVILYSDVSFRDLVQEMKESGEVEFPKIVRAVKIK